MFYKSGAKGGQQGSGGDQGGVGGSAGRLEGSHRQNPPAGEAHPAAEGPGPGHGAGQTQSQTQKGEGGRQEGRFACGRKIFTTAGSLTV